MSWSIKILTIRGIPIRVHASFLLVLMWAAYIGYTGAGGRRGMWQENVLFMVVFILLLFVCVALHELGHSLVAQRLGIQVHDITLWPIGGIARIRRTPERPSHEFLITAAGPATNVVLALLIGVGLLLWLGPQQILATLSSPRQIAALLTRTDFRSLLFLLLLNNLLLALFNLIPAFPMDGGRLLRALLGVVLPFRRATQIASLVGQLVAGGMVALGLIIGDTLLMVVGAFVFLGAWQERLGVSTVEGLRSVLVRDVMQPLGARLHSLEAVGDAVARIGVAGQAVYVVVDGGRLVGLLTRAETVEALRKSGPEMRVGQCMRRQPLQLRLDEPVLHAQERMVSARVSAAVVVDDGRVLGTVTGADLARAAEMLEAFPGVVRRRREHERSPGGEWDTTRPS
jgi:Zn-dependent protease/CBS domain-containing protein